jgi:ACR3 family arsenite efflux pump ArsB
LILTFLCGFEVKIWISIYGILLEIFIPLLAFVYFMAFIKVFLYYLLVDVNFERSCSELEK